MNASKDPDGQTEMETDFDQVFAAYQQVFAEIVQNATDEIRQAIAEAQQTITAQLKEAGLDQQQPDVAPDAEAPNAPITSEMVDDAFAKAKEILKQTESTVFESQTDLHAHQENLMHAQQEKLEEMFKQTESTTAGAPPGSFTPPESLPPPVVPIPDDPVAATDQMMSQAMESLNAALVTLFQAIPSDTGAAETR